MAMLSKLSSVLISDLSSLVLNVCVYLPDIACRLQNLVSGTSNIKLLIDDVQLCDPGHRYCGVWAW